MKTIISHVGKSGMLPAMAIILSAALLSACTKEGQNENDLQTGQEKTASLTITLSGVLTPESRSVAPIEEEAVNELKEKENAIYNATVFVFNSNGILDRRHDFEMPNMTETITGLVAGAKKVVVLANVPSGITFPDEISYSWFEDKGNVIDLDTQTLEKGLFMSGETDITLEARKLITATVQIRRLVAKVKLGKVTINAESGHDVNKFELTGVAIMKARASVLMGVPSTAYTANAFYGGIKGEKSVLKPYLSETISKSDNQNRYFYVLPGDNADANATLLTLAGTYDGVTTYFPFRINDKVFGNADGTFIKRNNIYTVNVTLKRLGGGSTNPEEPGDPADLELTIEPQDWELEISQDVEW